MGCVLLREEKELPSNAIEAQGILIKEIYKKFGKESLELIKDVLGRQGRALGLKMKKNLPDSRLSSVAKRFIKNWDPSAVKVISISDEKFQIQGTKCPFGLEGNNWRIIRSFPTQEVRTALGKLVKAPTTIPIAKKPKTIS